MWLRSDFLHIVFIIQFTACNVSNIRFLLFFIIIIISTTAEGAGVGASKLKCHYYIICLGCLETEEDEFWKSLTIWCHRYSLSHFIEHQIVQHFKCFRFFFLSLSSHPFCVARLWLDFEIKKRTGERKFKLVHRNELMFQFRFFL